MIRRTTAVVVVALAAAVAAAQAEATVRGENPQTRKRLAEVEQKLRAGKAAEAAEDLQKILDDAGDDLVTADGKSFVPARRYVHRFVAQLPPAELKLYQDRVDAPAKALLAAGDPASLRTLLDRHFCARPGADALLRLGDRHCERGEIAAAETAWRQLTDSPFPGDVAHPNRPGNSAAVKARLGLVAVYRGDAAAYRRISDDLRANHPHDAGVLAGVDGIYADTLAAAFARKPVPTPPTDPAGTWTTLGGSPARTGRATGPLPPFLPMRPSWAVPLTRDDAALQSAGDPAKLPPLNIARTLGFHPVVVGDTVYVADAARVLAFDLRTGRPQPGFNGRLVDTVLVPGQALRIPSRYDADYTLTATPTALLARFGPPVVLPPADAGRPASAVAAINLADLSLKWSQPPPAADGTPAGWEGAPIPIGNVVVAASTRSDGGRVVHSLAGYTADGRRRIWTADVADTALALPATKARHELVSVAGPLAVACTHTGLIAAVHAATGKPAWAYRYDRTRSPTPKPRDINPPVCVGGRVYVAPTDADAVYAFDAVTGRLVWQSAPVEVNQLVGVAAGKVVCTVLGPIPGVKAYAAETGSTDGPDGWVQHDDPGLRTFGRGLLTDEHFLWPTSAGLFTLKLRDGLPARQPNLGPHGNLAFAGGVLLVATPTELWGYVSQPTYDPPAVPLMGLRPTPPYRLVAAGTGDRAVSPAPARPPALRVPPTVEPVPAPPPAPPFPPVALPRPPRAFPAVAVVDGVLARVGDQHLVKYEPGPHRVAWVLDGLSRNRFDPDACWPGLAFLPHLSADADRAVAFTAAGRGLLLDTNTGTVLNDFDAPAPEHCGPAAFAGHVAAHPAGPGTVVGRHRDTAAKLWTYPAKRAAERPASLAGVAAGVAAADGSFYTAVTRTFGVELDRLRADRGTSKWPAPILLPAFAFDPANLIVTPAAVVAVLPDRAVGLAPDTGRTLWDLPLDGGPFAPTAAANAVVLTGPAAPNHSVSPAAFARNPHPALLPARVRAVYDLWSDRTVRVLAVDPATGKILAELALPADGPGAAATVTAAGLVVTAGTKSYRIR